MHSLLIFLCLSPRITMQKNLVGTTEVLVYISLFKWSGCEYSGTLLYEHSSSADTHDIMDIQKVPSVLPFTSLYKQPLNSGHPAFLYSRQLSRPQSYEINTHQISAVTHITSLCLQPFPPGYSKGKLRKHSRVVLNGWITPTMPTGNIPKVPELETPRYKGQNVGSQWCPLQRGFTVVQICKQDRQ